MDITKLQQHLPKEIYDQLPETIAQSSPIDGPKRLSHLCGQCKHESDDWKHFTENLNYSAEGLTKTFHKYFPTIESTVGYARNPQKIANKVYANRIGNGDEQSGDGWLHRGYGAIQTTGKQNQEAFFISIGLPKDSDPSLIATKYALQSAAFFFTNNNLWVICDKGVDLATVTILTNRINGGSLGLSQRVQFTQEYYNILT